jgi:hypothetical protein
LSIKEALQASRRKSRGCSRNDRLIFHRLSSLKAAFSLSSLSPRRPAGQVTGKARFGRKLITVRLLLDFRAMRRSSNFVYHDTAKVRTFTLLLICLGLAAQLPGQPGATPRFAKPVPMPGDRARDAYAIYSELLKSGPIEWRNASRKQWLVEDTTNAIPLDVACHPASKIISAEMNPHDAVEAPKDRQTEWNEVLTDYDQHCHDVIQLDLQSFRTELPVRLLSAEDQQRFMKDPRRPPAEFADAAGLHRFTEVFFNRNHTLALVEQGMWCGSLCGNWSWVVLERKERQWQMLPWVHAFTIS